MPETKGTTILNFSLGFAVVCVLDFFLIKSPHYHMPQNYITKSLVFPTGTVAFLLFLAYHALTQANT